VEEIEAAVHTYFSGLRLPPDPTIYDYLVLSLRPKDVIATFNWDPFLWLAAERNAATCETPQLAFLHGNVAVGYCPNHPVKGRISTRCHQCGEPYRTTKLLYPVTSKNYASNAFIDAEWSALRNRLPHAFLLTIFGYGAPSSDSEAVELMKCAWGTTEDRRFEQTEIVDIRDPDDLEETWKPFIHTHHVDMFHDLFDTFLLSHPRRSIEAALKQYLEAKFISENRAPRGCSLLELQSWHRALAEIERAHRST